MRPHTDLTLHGFDEDGCGVLIDRRFECFDIAVGHVHDSRNTRREGSAVGFLRRQRQRAHGAAVEGAFDGDDEGASPSGGAPGHLEGRLIGFGSRVREEHGGSGTAG